MPLTPEQQAKFDALKKPKTAPAAQPDPAPADTGAEVTVTAPPESPPPAETPATPPPVERVQTTPVRTGLGKKKAPAGSFAELAAELAATEAALAEANTKLEAAKDAMRKALA